MTLTTAGSRCSHPCRHGRNHRRSRRRCPRATQGHWPAQGKLTENAVETLLPRDLNAICNLFKDLLGRDVARDNDAIADAVANRFAGVRREFADPDALERLLNELSSRILHELEVHHRVRFR